jgi:ribose transport system permease protein
MKKIKAFLTNNTSVIGLFIMMAIVTLIDPNFIQLSNLSNIVRQVSINGLIALGMTFVILTGGIDLSVGSVFALTGAVLAKMLIMGVNSFLAVGITLALGLVLGIINGILIAKGRLQAFIATLGTVTLYRGITRVFMEGKPITGFKSDFVDNLGRGYILGIPIPIIILVIAILIAWFLTRRTVFGKEVYAVGGNEKRLSFQLSMSIGLR